ncbi:MAG: ABC transporter substrate binding protein [Pseudolabrys sp.]|jgi:putative tryptophan/tyrosine transport system substrate-binding protein
MARERDEPFRQALRELGYVEGKNIVIEYRFAEGKFDRLSAAELVELKVDLIVANVTQASLAAKGATRTIPIVMQGVSDPIGTGLVASLARPGADITGTSAMSAIGPWLNEPRFNRYDALADLGGKEHGELPMAGK